MRLIAFTGLPRSGKDTAAEHLVEHHKFVRRSFAQPLKEAAAILLGRELWEMEGSLGFDREAILPEWGFSTRWFLQRFGTEAIRHGIAEDFWIRRMRNSLNPARPTVITDARFENEGALVRELGGIVVGVTRPGVVASNHASDAGIATDYVIHNDGSIMDLWRQVDKVLRAYTGEPA